jgi:hypothetical protein
VLLCGLEGLPDLSIKMVWRKLAIAANGMLPGRHTFAASLYRRLSSRAYVNAEAS